MYHWQANAFATQGSYDVGVLVDPGTVLFSWRVIAGGSPSLATTYTCGVGAQIVRDSVGHYHVDLDTSTVTAEDGVIHRSQNRQNRAP